MNMSESPAEIWIIANYGLCDDEYIGITKHLFEINQQQNLLWVLEQYIPMLQQLYICFHTCEKSALSNY